MQGKKQTVLIEGIIHAENTNSTHFLGRITKEVYYDRQTITSHHIALHCIVLHCFALHCIALHCIDIALHYITLHYTTFLKNVALGTT